MSKGLTPILTRRQVDDLGRFRPVPYLVTSLYLDIDRSTPGGRGRPAALKVLARDARAGLEARDLTRKQRQSVEEDLTALERIARDASARGDRAVCSFVASAVGYKQVLGLPHPVKNRLVIDETPYVRPLAAMLGEYPRYLVVLADRSRARLLAAHMGRVHQLRVVSSDVPGHVKEGGYRGNAERGIERHIGEHVARHLKAVAEAVRETMGDSDFESIILGGPSEAVAGLKEQLGSYLRGLVSGGIQADLASTPEEIGAECQVFMARASARRDQELVERLTDGLSSSGLGVAGVLSTLGALRRGAVAALLVAADFAEPGTECKHCGFLGLEGAGECPACGKTGTRTVPDLVREMIDRATAGGGEIRHIASEPSAARLRSMGGVGALLRFRLV